MATRPNLNTSFIPKRSLAKTQVGYRRPHSLFLTASMIALLLSIGAYAGLFFYERSLQKVVSERESQLSTLSEGFDKSLVNQARELQGSLDVVKSLLAGHVAVSPIFTALEADLIQKSRLTTFNYTINKSDGGLELMIDAEATGFAEAAALFDVLKQSPAFKSITLKDTLLTDTGHVLLKMDSVVDPTFVSYSNILESMQAAETKAGSDIPPESLNTES